METTEEKMPPIPAVETTAEGEAGAVHEEMQTQPTGRDAFMGRYKTAYPEKQEDPSEDELYEHANKGWSERDEYEGKYGHLNSLNETLAANISEYPQFAQFVAMVANGANPWFALGSCIGPNADKLDEESQKQFENGKAEYNKRIEQVKGNFDNYTKDLKAYGEANGLTPEQVDELDDKIMEIADAFADRDIPTEVIDIVFKGMDYDNENAAREEAAKLAGKNAAIDEMKGKNAKKSALPDLTGNRSNKTPGAGISKNFAPKVQNIQDALTEKDI